MAYQVQLLVLEEDVLKEVPLFDVTLLPKLDFRVHNDVYLKFWNWDETPMYGPYSMAREFLTDVHNVNRHFACVVADREESFLETLLATKVTFAGRRSYLRKRKEEGLPLDGQSAGTFYEQDGFLVSLQRSLDHVSSTIVHEFGHALDDLLNPVNYKQRTPTMREVMAIFVEETVGINEYYLTKPHRHAKEILRCLAHTRFSLLDFPEQWEFLNGITDEKDLPARISSSFPPERPLIKLLDTITSFGKSIGINSK